MPLAPNSLIGQVPGYWGTVDAWTWDDVLTGC